MQKRKLWFGLAALAAAWSFDFLFWGRQGSLSFLVWTALLLIIGWVLAWHEKVKPSIWSIVLSVLILAFAVIPAWRSEHFTRFSSVMVTLLGLLLLISTFLDGYWPQFRFVDYIIRFAVSLWAGVSRGFKFFARDESGVPPLPGQKTVLQRIGSVLLGIVIALPIVLVLGLILTAADPIFSDMITRFFSLDKLPEYLFRFTYVVVGAFVILGLLLHAILPKKPAEKPDTQKAAIKPFLGMTEGSIVLAAIDVLFIAFIIVQIRYLFGGQANISAAGYTYSEYARRGFAELVTVSVLSLAIYLAMRAFTKKETRTAKVAFSVLSITMLAGVLVILASSLTRLLLYENAYSFSELRTYTHIFIFWLAGLIAATIVFEIINRPGRFGLALMIMVLGFTATLGIMNVDGFVARQNIKLGHLKESAPAGGVDFSYIFSLSDDAVPQILKAYKDPTLPQETHNLIGIDLACRTITLADTGKEDWRSIRFGNLIAYRLLHENKASWSQFTPTIDEYGNHAVKANGETYSCYVYDWMNN